MKRLIVRYKVKEERAEENIQYIQRVFQALEEKRPEGLRYASFQLDDGCSFVHIASIETKDESNPLTAFEEFQAFTKDIASRCEEKPVASAVNTIGAYECFS